MLLVVLMRVKMECIKMYKYVTLYGDNSNAYIKHMINVGKCLFSCHEDQKSRYNWFYNDKPLLFSQVKIVCM